MGRRSSIASFPGAARLCLDPPPAGGGLRRSQGNGVGAVTGCVPLRLADCLCAAAPSLPHPSAGTHPQRSAIRVGAEGKRDWGQADGLGWSGFSLIIIFVRASTKFCGKCASAVS